MEKQTLAYPVTNHNFSIMRHTNLLRCPEITGIISAEYGMVSNHNGSPIWDCGEELPHAFKKFDCFDSGLQNADHIVIFPLEKEANFDAILSHIRNAIQQKKIIFSMHQFNLKITDDLQRLCLENNTIYEPLYKNKESTVKFEKFENRNSIYDFQKPIVTIAGLSPNCDLLDLELQLRQRFLQQGYKISQVASFAFAECFGFHSTPTFLYDSKYSGSEKIIMYNRFLKQIEVRENPDILLVGIPGALFPFSKQFPNNFGLLPYYISQALVADCNITAINYGNYELLSFKELKKYLKYRFDLNPDFIVMSNIYPDLSDANSYAIIKYHTITLDEVEKKIQGLNLPDIIYHAKKSHDIDELYERIVDNLSANVIY